MPGYGWGGCCGFGSYGWVGWIANLALTVGILLGLILLVVWVMRQFTRSHQESVSAAPQIGSAMLSARDILQIRYARGEITREKYLKMLEDIQ